MDEEDEGDDGHVIYSLLINSEHPLDSLVGLDGRRRPAADGDDYLYVVYETAFDEPDWAARATRLEEIIQASLDALDGTGISLDALAHPDVLVRAFFTFPRGAETISAKAVQRLAACHATIWIDA